MKLKVIAAQQSPVTKRKYRDRVGHNGRGISGKYNSKWGWLAFDSSYELVFIRQMETREDIITVERGRVIDYEFDGVKRQYLIDFTVKWLDGGETWNEIKSGYVGKKVDKIEKLRAKLSAAIAASNQELSTKVILITEKNAFEIIGCRMPRGTHRGKMLKDAAPKVVWHNAKDKERYG